MFSPLCFVWRCVHNRGQGRSLNGFFYIFSPLQIFVFSQSRFYCFVFTVVFSLLCIVIVERWCFFTMEALVTLLCVFTDVYFVFPLLYSVFNSLFTIVFDVLLYLQGGSCVFTTEAKGVL